MVTIASIEIKKRNSSVLGFLWGKAEDWTVTKRHKKIGVTGLEPATSRPPAERSTKLSHTPK